MDSPKVTSQSPDQSELSFQAFPGSYPDGASKRLSKSSKALIYPSYLRGLERIPLISIDTETDSVSPAAANVVEFAAISCKARNALGGNVSSEDSFIKLPDGIVMNEKASLVNGISSEMLEMAPTMEEYIPVIANIFEAACFGPTWLCGYNIRKYDVPLLRRILADHGYHFPEPKLIDVFDLFCYHFRNLRSRKLDSACEMFGIPIPGHRAKKDAQAAIHILRNMREYLGFETSLPGDLELLREAQACAVYSDNEYGRWDWYLYQRGDIVYLGFGKYHGMPLKDVATMRDAWYRNYLISNAFFYAPEAVRIEVIRHDLCDAKRLRIDPKRMAEVPF